ncbi:MULTISPECIES: hypothetical protein [unclassified Leifsonia]|uniref:hypothetical protein n=1 Tax=unclassified Leifsonia TaxID=2663824 RepID=UPI0006FF66FE|nr:MULTISPECIES: hypothetical protein [unclassified Leifsonia]KQX07556.1 hypothetical protein ASC59_07385 [Leifsonia sp. Root1293]KRA11838.1 hypothetical protein ASD61_07385 [Leifsonia sp. Root60]
MTLPTTDTVVLYPAGSTRNGAVVLHLETVADGSLAVILDETACHPVDAGWPDQGSDRAVLVTSSGREIAVTEAVVAATDGETLFIGTDVPVRKGEEGWTFVVAHLVAPDAALAERDEVTVVVDEQYRNALSIGHTACHLASLALNRAVADRWTKDVRADGLGAPDFDAAAIASSLIRENGSTDVFRLNKSLRRKGFTTDGLSEELSAIEAATSATLAAWISEDAPVHIDVSGPGLTDRRSWVADLAEASVSIPCGGTHVSALSELGSLAVSLELSDVDGTPTLTMLTDAAG